MASPFFIYGISLVSKINLGFLHLNWSKHKK
jgi:hypothetical protein